MFDPRPPSPTRDIHTLLSVPAPLTSAVFTSTTYVISSCDFFPRAFAAASAVGYKFTTVSPPFCRSSHTSAGNIACSQPFVTFNTLTDCSNQLGFCPV